MNNRVSRIGRLLIIIGIMLTISGILLQSVRKKTKDYIKIEATVSKVEMVKKKRNNEETKYHTYVKYKVNDIEYEEELGVFSNCKEGDKITILYNPKDPKKITLPVNSKTTSIIIIVGIPLFIIGVLSVFKKKKS